MFGLASAIVLLGCGRSPESGNAGVPVVVDPVAAPRSASIVIAGRDEPGRRLIVTGRVLDLDGQPMPATRVGVYHADARGQYGTGNLPGLPGRLAGWLISDSLGRYRVETVRPGGYGGFPAHMHFVVQRPMGARYLELRFADDPLVWRRERERAQQSPSTGGIRPVGHDSSGADLVVRDLATANAFAPMLDRSRIPTIQQVLRDSVDLVPDFGR